MVIKYSAPFRMNESSGFCAFPNVHLLSLAHCLTFMIFMLMLWLSCEICLFYLDLLSGY